MELNGVEWGRGSIFEVHVNVSACAREYAAGTCTHVRSCKFSRVRVWDIV